MATWQDGGKLYFDTNGGGYVDMNTGKRYYNDGSGSAIAPTVGTATNLLARWSGNAMPDMSASQSNQALAGWQPNMIPGNQNDYNPFSSDKATSLGVNWGTGTTGDTGANYGASSGSSGGASWGGSASTSTPYGGSTLGNSISGTSLQENPYLKQMGDYLTNQMTDAFNTKVAPQISRGAVLSGGFGGSRQGVIEANANNDLQQNIGSALANLYGNGYNTATSYDLGLRNNQLGYDNLDRNINNDNLGWQLQGANFGLGLYNQLLNNDTNQYNTGTTVQNAPMNYWQNFTNQANAIGNGYGTTTGTQNYGTNPLLSAYGGSQMFSGMFGNGNSYNANANRGTYGTNWGTGDSYGNYDYGAFL